MEAIVIESPVLGSVTEFVIKRSEWLHGETSRNSYLYRSTDQKRCCVGSYLKACGVPDRVMMNRGGAISDINTLTPLVEAVAPWLVNSSYGVKQNSDYAHRLYSLNDGTLVDEGDREELITEAFAKQGIKVTFVD